MLAPIAVGLVVYVGLSYVMAMYTWTAIHSGWSQPHIDAFYLAIKVVPPILGILSALAAYRLINALKTLRVMADASKAGHEPRR